MPGEFWPPRRDPDARRLPDRGPCDLCGQTLPHDRTDMIIHNRREREMLHDDLADGDRHLTMGPGLRRVYRIDRSTQVISMAPGVGQGGRAIENEGADRNNQAYLRGLGWGD